jgi:alpha-D-ribose 1-methylphosphonate 5-triphosphate diphosphatase
MPTAFINGKIVTESGILEEHALLLEGDTIQGVVPMEELPRYAVPMEVDVRGQYVSPGFIDVHSDMIEQIIQPRPTSLMDFELALKEGEKQLVNQGVTTMYHSLSLYNDDLFGVKEVRKSSHVMRLARLISSLHERDHLIHHRFHARFEIDNVGCVELVRELIGQGLVHEFSVMDHTPGQGQFSDLAGYRKFIGGYRDGQLSDEEWEKIMSAHNGKAKASFEQIAELVKLALSNGVPVASHDDDSVEKVELVRGLGVGISEFPITMDVARAARKHGMHTVAGAPNILLGGSHTGNLCAAEAIKEGCVDVLCSDYYPAALLHAVFALHNKHGLPLHQAFNLVTANPARAVGIDARYGSIAPGRAADLLVIDTLDGYPVITQVIIGGKCASRLEYRV